MSEALVTTPDAVISVMERILRVDLSIDRSVTPSTDLLNELALDSLALITVVVGLEEHFNIALTEEDALGVRTVGDLAALVVSKQAGAK